MFREQRAQKGGPNGALGVTDGGERWPRTKYSGVLLLITCFPNCDDVQMNASRDSLRHTFFRNSFRRKLPKINLVSPKEVSPEVSPSISPQII